MLLIFYVRYHIFIEKITCPLIGYLEFIGMVGLILRNLGGSGNEMESLFFVYRIVPFWSCQAQV